MSNLERTKRLSISAFLLGCALFLFAATGSARAADSVYWPNFEAGTISFANLAGGGAGNLDITGATAAKANGIAIDAAAGKVYWVTATAPLGKIYYANLSGGGGGELNTAGASPGFSIGLAIDPTLGRIYWANDTEGVDKISYANLNGSGGGDLDTTGATVEDPVTVTVELAAGRIYWANKTGANRISYANLTGGGGGTLNLAGVTGEQDGLAFGAGKVYWADYGASKISYANLNGSGGGDLNTAGATVDGPFGVALDPAAGRVYWANEVGNKISYANLNGSGGADLDTSGATIGQPAFPVLLEAPLGAGPPVATGKSKPGSSLSCAAASWAPDLLESFLYRAPQSISTQWLKNGQPLPGETAGSLVATKKGVGTYSCQNTATNHAGSTTQTSAPVSIFSLGKAKVNTKKGTAILPVKVAGPVTLNLSGKQLIKQKKARAAGSTGIVKVLIKAKGKAKKTLAKKGKVKVKLTITVTPTGGSAAKQTTSVVLKQAS
jgi:hypothetical protein